MQNLGCPYTAAEVSLILHFDNIHRCFQKNVDKLVAREEEDSYIIDPDDPTDFRLFTCGHSSYGAIFELSPLASDTVYLGIPCAPVLLEDEESPLKAVFTLPDGDGEREFELIVR